MRKRKESLNFYSLLIRQMTVIRDAVAALCDYCEEPSQRRATSSRSRRRRPMPSAGSWWRTSTAPSSPPSTGRTCSASPLSVDDLADYAWTTVKELRIYDITLR